MRTACRHPGPAINGDLDDLRPVVALRHGTFVDATLTYASARDLGLCQIIPTFFTKLYDYACKPLTAVESSAYIARTSVLARQRRRS
jgi:hypothetical protein